MRQPIAAAIVALTAAVALVAVPTLARPSSVTGPTEEQLFRPVELASVAGAATAPTQDPADDSAAALQHLDSLREPAHGLAPRVDARPEVAQPAAARAVVRPTPTPKPPPAPAGRAPAPAAPAATGWRYDAEVSWYGPGFYGNRTACGHALTTTLQGVAHRSLPCGTMVSFRNPRNGAVITVPVVDRGPYVDGRQWDLTGGACVALDHCYTGPMEWRYP